jgi:DNA modification methylase
MYQLHHGGCLDILPTLEAQSVDAVIADIPSGRTACAWDSVIPFEPMWEQLRRVTKPRGAIVLLGCTQPFTSALVMSNPSMFRYEWIWEKDKATGALIVNKQPLRAHENILVFSKKTCGYYPQKTSGHPMSNRSSKKGQAGSTYNPYMRGLYEGSTERYPRSVQKFNTVNSAHVQLHPTQKPLALLEYLVKTYTNEGDTVLDFTMGSGTTGAACGNLERNFIGIEKDEGYFNVAQERIATAYEPLRAMQGVA